MPSSNPLFRPACLEVHLPGVFILAVLSTAVYQAIKLNPPLLFIFSFFILFIGANIQVIHNRFKRIPSGTYVVLLSIATLLAGLFADKHQESTFESCCLHWTISFYGLMFFEIDRFQRLRRKVREEEEAPSGQDVEKGDGQTPEDDLHA